MDGKWTYGALVMNVWSFGTDKPDDKKIDFLQKIDQLDIIDLKKRLFLKQNEIKRRFNQYLLYGGYPELGELTQEQKWEKLGSIIQTVLEKDLQSLVKAEYLFSAKKLLEILSYRIGNRISFENLASQMQLNIKTVRRLTSILEGLFLIKLIFPQASFGNEYKKAPKIYFNDLGIRHQIVKSDSLPADRAQLGPIIENFILCQLIRYSAYIQDFKINYWQDYNQNEVDFILKRGDVLISIEVKHSRTQNPKFSAGVKNFIKKYKPRFHITATADYYGTSNFRQTKIYYVPAYVFGLLI